MRVLVTWDALALGANNYPVISSSKCYSRSLKCLKKWKVFSCISYHSFAWKRNISLNFTLTQVGNTLSEISFRILEVNKRSRLRCLWINRIMYLKIYPFYHRECISTHSFSLRVIGDIWMFEFKITQLNTCICNAADGFQYSQFYGQSWNKFQALMISM